jgi:hypothetical protein
MSCRSGSLTAPSIYDGIRSSCHPIFSGEFRTRKESGVCDLVIQPGNTTTLDDRHMILSFFRWTAFSTDAFETFWTLRRHILMQQHFL